MKILIQSLLFRFSLNYYRSATNIKGQLVGLVFLNCSILSPNTDPLICVDLVVWKELNKCFLYFFLKSFFGDAGHSVHSSFLLVEINYPLQIIKELSTLDNNFATEAVLKCIQTVHVLVVETECIQFL